MKKCEQLQWHECWNCEDYDQLEKRCDKTGATLPYNTYVVCATFRPRDLGECETCRYYPCLGMSIAQNFREKCYEYKYKENK